MHRTRAARGALNPLAPEDVLLLESVNRGAFMIHGLRNRDIRAALYAEGPDAGAAETKHRPARVTRPLTLLRAHGLIARVPRTHRYQVTEKRRTTITALIAARGADMKALLKSG